MSFKTRLHWNINCDEMTKNNKKKTLFEGFKELKWREAWEDILFIRFYITLECTACYGGELPASFGGGFIVFALHLEYHIT